MDDPMMRQSSGSGSAKPGSSTLFNSTSRLAGEAAARSSGDRIQKILAILAEGPHCLFEVASQIGVFDHQISGRFTELAKEGLIERSGDRRLNPATSCQCDVWRLRDLPPSIHSPSSLLADKQGYPATLIIDGQPFDRGVLPDTDVLPGLPYSARTDAGSLRNYYRVALIGCDFCGRRLAMFPETIAGKQVKRYRCTNEKCNRVYELQLVKLPGGSETPALVMKHL